MSHLRHLSNAVRTSALHSPLSEDPASSLVFCTKSVHYKFPLINIFTETLPARDRFFSPLWSQKALCPLTGGQGAAFCMKKENNSPEEAFSNINPSVKDMSSLKIHLCRGVYWLFFFCFKNTPILA